MKVKEEVADESEKNDKKGSSKKSLRRFLGEDGETFKGWAKTAQALLNDRKHQMKEGRFLKKIIKIYKLSSKFLNMSEEEQA